MDVDQLAREAAQYIRSNGKPLEFQFVVAELQKKGCSVQQAADVIDHGLSNGALVLLGSRNLLDAGFQRGKL